MGATSPPPWTWRRHRLCRVLHFLLLLLLWGTSEANEEHAVLPPRGWNSYDSFSWIVDENAYLQNAQIIAEKLLPHGYQYAVIDFLWYRKYVEGAFTDSYGFDNIDEWGRPFPDLKRFPSSSVDRGFSQIASKVHGMGLKFGIHLMKGISVQAVNANTPILDIKTGKPYIEDGRQWTARDIGLSHRTCAWMTHGFMSVNTNIGAGRAFLRSLYRQYADWGVDFVKVDCIFGTDYSPEEIITVSELLQEIDRPIILSISPGTAVTPALAENISDHVNMYRITGDDWDNWNDVSSHFGVSSSFAAAKKIGATGLRGRSWPDLDMLPFGWLTDPMAELQGGPCGPRTTLRSAQVKPIDGVFSPAESLATAAPRLRLLVYDPGRFVFLIQRRFGDEHSSRRRAVHAGPAWSVKTRVEHRPSSTASMGFVFLTDHRAVLRTPDRPLSLPFVVRRPQTFLPSV